jgi:hypothetical protein
MNPDCNPVEQLARQEQLDAWYALDGRHNHDHPMHSLYTGLAAEYARPDAAPCSVEVAQ